MIRCPNAPPPTTLQGSWFCCAMGRQSGPKKDATQDSRMFRSLLEVRSLPAAQVGWSLATIFHWF